MISTKDIVWLAGLLEGEGCFSLDGNGAKSRGYGKLVIVLQMTDRDVVARAAKILGGPVAGPYRPKVSRKEVWTTRVWCRRAASWMMTLHPLMGERRQARIQELLTHWRSRPARLTREDYARRDDQFIPTPQTA